METNAKRLILFRHGKSDWDAPFDQDHDRPLAKRGIKAVKGMGKLLAQADQLPDLVRSSSAVRAHTTVQLAAKAGKWSCPIEVRDDLYETEPDRVLPLIQSTPKTVQTLLLVGHEPTWSTLAALLIGGGQLCIPTAAMVRLDFAVESWSQVDYGIGKLVWLLQPRFFIGGEKVGQR
jgi:phosphohistidine phosphatase